MEKQNEVKCENCQDKKQIPFKTGEYVHDRYGNKMDISHYKPCPDCTDQLAEDEEIREVSLNDIRKVVEKELGEDILEVQGVSSLWAIAYSQSAKLKEQTEEIEECHKVMQKQATTNETISSLLSEAVNVIKEGVLMVKGFNYFIEIDSSEYGFLCSSEDILKKLEQFTKEN